jgi:hypothetical protein
LKKSNQFKTSKFLEQDIFLERVAGAECSGKGVNKCKCNDKYSGDDCKEECGGNGSID